MYSLIENCTLACDGESWSSEVRMDVDESMPESNEALVGRSVGEEGGAGDGTACSRATPAGLAQVGGVREQELLPVFSPEIRQGLGLCF